MKRYPRSRSDVGPTLEPAYVTELLQTFWGMKATEVERANCRCVFFFDQDEGPRLVFRSNPGWDGPTPPLTIVEFLDHLSRSGAPCPSIVPTIDGQLSCGCGDFTLSVESFLGETDADELEDLNEIGAALAALHESAVDLVPFPSTVKSVADYVLSAIEYCEGADLRSDLSVHLRGLLDQLREFVTDGATCCWILCHGDVRGWNAVLDVNGRVRFTDFGGCH